MDKDLVASYLIRKYPVSLLALAKTGQPPPTRPSVILSRLLVAQKVCESGCAESDQKLITYIRGSMLLLLNGSNAPAFNPDRSVLPDEFFRAESSAQILCDSRTDAEAPGAMFLPPVKAEAILPGFRVRGKPDQLYIDRAQKNEFAATEKANVSYARDDAAGTNTFKGVAFVGYWMELMRDKVHGQRAEFIPYLGIDRSVVRVGPESQAKPSAKSSASVGSLASLFLVTRSGGAPFGHLLNIRPDFSADHQTGTRLISAAVEYFPVRNGVINDFWRLRKGDNSFASAKWIFSLKANAGHFTDRGSGPEAVNRGDYTRLGGKVGIGIVSNNPAIPLDFVATYTSMAAVKGSVNIDYRSAALSYSFDPDKYFGITLGYKKGKREDTAIIDDEVTLGLSARF